MGEAVSDCVICGYALGYLAGRNTRDTHRSCVTVMCESLATLAHNLAIAGALCRSFELGEVSDGGTCMLGWHPERFECDDRPWRPNINAKAAP